MPAYGASQLVSHAIGMRRVFYLRKGGIARPVLPDVTSEIITTQEQGAPKAHALGSPALRTARAGHADRAEWPRRCAAHP
jgi:hypothetical protein